MGGYRDHVGETIFRSSIAWLVLEQMCVLRARLLRSWCVAGTAMIFDTHGVGRGLGLDLASPFDACGAWGSQSW